MARIEKAFSLIRNGANIKQGLDDSGYPITRIETISNRIVDRSKMGYAGITDIAKYSDYILQDGDILMSHINSETHLGKVALYKKEGEETIIHGMNLLCLRPKQDLIDSRYAFYYLSSDAFLRQIPRITKKSVNQASFNVAALKGLSIAIPDIEQQRRMIHSLEKIDGLITLRKEQLAKLDELVKARFVEMFGDPASNPMHWDTKTFRQASVRLSDGPFGSNLKSEHYVQSGIRVIRLGNIGVGRFINNDQSYISEEHYEKLKKYTCKAGDIVIGTLGEPNLRACLVPETIEFAINKADCVHYVPRPEILNKYFVCQYINCPETLSLASGMVHGQTRSRISSGQLAEMPIFIPPMNLQQQFATFVEQTNKTKLTIQASLDKLEVMKKALMQEYFG